MHNEGRVYSVRAQNKPDRTPLLSPVPLNSCRSVFGFGLPPAILRPDPEPQVIGPNLPAVENLAPALHHPERLLIPGTSPGARSRDGFRLSANIARPRHR